MIEGKMILASLILIVSSALFLFYLQTTCQKILRRQFQQDYFQSIVNANRLEFPSVRKALDEYDGPVDYARFRMTLKCDYLALTYLLKNAANVNQRFTWEERILMLYFQAIYLLLVTRHAIPEREKSPRQSDRDFAVLRQRRGAARQHGQVRQSGAFRLSLKSMIGSAA